LPAVSQFDITSGLLSGLQNQPGVILSGQIDSLTRQ
jgi:hypothetical protein